MNNYDNNSGLNSDENPALIRQNVSKNSDSDKFIIFIENVDANKNGEINRGNESESPGYGNNFLFDENDMKSVDYDPLNNKDDSAVTVKVTDRPESSESFSYSENDFEAFENNADLICNISEKYSHSRKVTDNDDIQCFDKVPKLNDLGNLGEEYGDIAQFNWTESLSTVVPAFTIESLQNVDIYDMESSFAHMILCEEPPQDFSPVFLGQDGSVCKREEEIRALEFEDAWQLCLYVYNIIHEDAEPFDIGSYNLEDGSQLVLIFKNEFVEICSPIFERFDKCQRIGFLTVCFDARVAFVHDHGCQKPSTEDVLFDSFLSVFFLEGDEDCFDRICEGKMRVVDSEVNGIQYRLLNTLTDDSNNSCAYVYDGLNILSNEYDEILYITYNNIWACCYPLYVVLWVGNPEEHDLLGSWHYLPYSCRASEIVLIVMVGLITLSSLVGNLIVVIVMFINYRPEESSMIRTSLALADLLLGIFVICPSLHQHLLPFNTPTDFLNISSTDYSLTSNPSEKVHHIHLTNVGSLYSNEAWDFFRGIVLSTCSLVSLFCAFLLSLERYIITSRALKYKEYFTLSRIKTLLVSFWIIAAVDAVLLSYDKEGRISIIYRTFEKFPIAYSNTSPTHIVANLFFYCHFIVFYFMGSSTIVFSMLAMWYFHREQKRVAIEFRDLQMRVTGPYREENRYIRNTMIIILTFYVLSVLPITIDIALHTIKYTFSKTHLFTYTSAWLFLGASAWNPWMYNIRSH
ncbi:hypothetical protein SK128_014620, partial [Halocaridina rubra]